MGAVAVASLGCTGSEGPTGPEGPQGEQGPQGPQGPAGTANVYYSDWTPFDVGNWSDAHSAFGQTRRDYPIDEPLIDAEVLATGTVAVYARIPTVTGTKVFPLPWIYHLTSGNAQVLDFELNTALINIGFYNLVDDSTDPGTFGDIVEYRYIIIPGGMPAPAMQPSLEDYDAVLSYFGIAP